MYLLSALAIGFFGSFHCVAMCGPIVLALTSTKDNYYQFFLNRMIYNSGRIVTYSILGFLVGAVGHSLLLAGFQKKYLNQHRSANDHICHHHQLSSKNKNRDTIIN